MSLDLKEPHLKEWLKPPEDELRTRRQWNAIAGRISNRPASKRFSSARVGLAMAACFALFAIAALWMKTNHATLDANNIAASSNVVLADGSQVKLDAGATFAVPTNEAMHIAAVLETGAADFDVVPNRERVFTVVAEGVEVRVVGTAFRVDIAKDSHDVTVSVVHGIVEVRSVSQPGQVRRLGAGESWSTRGSVTNGTASANAPAGTSNPDTTTTALAASPDSSSPSDSASPATAPTQVSPSDDAKALFESANRARRAGDIARAATLYRELVARHPDDPRAQVAALEVARIEMDNGGDSSVAEGALKSASSAKVGSSVHEDALARLVMLYASKGNQKACEQSRAAYLSAYPDGVHAAQVRDACASR